MAIDGYYDGDEVPVLVESKKPLDSIDALSELGNTASGVRQIYDAMAPRPTDSTEVRIAKEVFRWSSVVAGAAAVAVVVL